MGFFDNVNANLRNLFEGKFRVGIPYDPYSSIRGCRFEYYDNRFSFKYMMKGEQYSQTYKYSDVLDVFHACNININEIKEIQVPDKIGMFGMLEMTIVYKNPRPGNYMRMSVYPANLTSILNDYKSKMNK